MEQEINYESLFDEVLTIVNTPRGDFEKMAYRLNVTPMSGEKVDNFYEKNVDNQQEKKNIFNWLFK